MAESVKSEEWLAELQRLANETPTTDGFLSVSEMGDRLHRAEQAVRKMLNRAKDMGMLETTRRQKESLNGVKSYVPVYRIKQTKKK